MKAVADFRKCTNWGGEKVVNGMKAVNMISVNLQWLISENLEILGGFLQAHVSKSPMPDFRKSANLGGTCAEHIVTKTLCIIQATNYGMFLQY